MAHQASCPSPSPQTHVHWVMSMSNGCHPTISSPVTLFFSSCNHSQHQGLFQWISSSRQVAKVLEFKLQHQSYQWVFRVDFLWDWLVWSPFSPRDSQESSLAPQFENINSLTLSLQPKNSKWQPPWCKNWIQNAAWEQFAVSEYTRCNCSSPK